MTIEEKAKAYDEALERVKPLYEWAKKDDSPMWSTYEYLFPQLAESEDERIRKELVEYHKQQFEKNRDQEVGLFHKDAIAYLEKQKERGPLTKEEEYTLHRIIEYLEDETCPSEWISLLHDIYCLPYKKQKEASKAIEAVERIDKYIDQHLANAHDMKDSNPDKKYYRGWDDALGKMAGILQDVYSEEKKKESLRDFIDNFPYGDEQKEPENTSASTMALSLHEELTEFELVLFNAVLDNNFVGAKGSENALAMIKKVAPELLAIAKKEQGWNKKPCLTCQEYEKGHKQGYTEGCTAGYNKAMKEMEQKEQKPAEWSKEDEMYLSQAIETLEHENYSILADKLKSLRPQYHGDVTMTEAYKMGLEAGKISSWKPTEHQMTILKAVKEYVERGSGYWGEALGSLIEDLEKLM